ncbi:scamp-domain-containing protein [Meira miltonrushii]|uniref:Scamp-domain-containing protein n=1 Tax=Meira miltonrushii TaxID=1280837 RepID=A0A316VR59_9BASI|nr:scamp-domain-containing protein [Meira miltonrushii]PWN37985.1 scamp-domain-containing protein [Meira miltonrushii]
MSTNDPFADRNALDANPFADPSVRNALSSSDRAYDEYDSKPYGGQDDESIAAPRLDRGDGGASNNRLEDIQRRERELEQRERDLQQRADHIQKHGRNNWPFFFPLIYHDIQAEIPPGDLQVAMTHIYYLWLLLVATLIINLVACVFIGVKELISAIVYLIFITPTSFMLWYRPVYNGFMKEHSLFYYMYFIFAGFHLAWSVYVFLGIPETGSAALLSTINSFNDHKLVAGILGIIVTIGFTLQGLGNLWYYKQIWKHNHEQGHTFAQARAELASHGAKAYFTRGSNV